MKRRLDPFRHSSRTPAFIRRDHDPLANSVHGCMAQRLADVLSIRPGHVASRLVIANSEVRLHPTSYVPHAAGTMLCMTPNMGRLLPHHLAEVTPVLEVAHARVSLAVLSGVPGLLGVVEFVGNHVADAPWWRASGDVLAVSATIHCSVVGKVAAARDLGGRGGETSAPFDWVCGVVGTMEIVMV